MRESPRVSIGNVRGAVGMHRHLLGEQRTGLTADTMIPHFSVHHALMPAAQEIQAAEAMAAHQAEEVRRLQGELQEARRNGA